MKRFCFAYVTAVVLIGGAIRATAGDVDPDLVGWWKLDSAELGVTADSSGQGHDGLVQGNPQWVPGRVGGAVQVDGSDDYIETNYREDLPQWTLCVWVKSPAAPSSALSAGPIHRELNYQLNWNHQTASFRGAVGLMIGGTWYSAGFGSLAENTWYHLAATFDGTALCAYLDADLISINANAQGVPNPEPASLKLGRHASAPQFFAGAIDDARIYRRALNAQEIQGVMWGVHETAWDPQPRPGAIVDLSRDPALSWSAGEGAMQHDVYLGTDENAVAAADTTAPLYWGRQSDTYFSLAGGLDLGGRYFWRIDEVLADGVTLRKGEVWAFTVSRQIVLDDFESYVDSLGWRIDDIWLDGSLNGTGAQVGNLVPPFAEQTIVHGGMQSMPLSYNNAVPPYYSETLREFPVAEDWTLGRPQTLSLWVRGEGLSWVQTAPGVFTMSAIGTDIWNQRDEFRYVCRQLNGDGSIVARVDSVVNTNVWAKAGVMIRASLDPSSAHAFMCITPDGRRAFQDRPTNGTGSCLTAHSPVGRIKLPFWVKVERKGDLFTGYYSTNGTAWVQQPVNEEVTTYQTTNPKAISMPPTVYIGLALSSHDGGAVTTATFSGVATTGTVLGDWLSASVGAEQPGGSPDDFYVVVEDSAGKTATVTNPDPVAVNTAAWTEWRIPLTSFADVNLCQVKKLGLGVGARETPTARGTGRIWIDDIALSNRSAISTFGIYLTETEELLLSDQDIAAYVQASHKIQLNASGIEKWNAHVAYDSSFEPPAPVLTGGLYQKEFAVRIDDKEYYRGKFWSIVSSWSYDGVVILDAAMPCDSNHSTLRIQNGYPSPTTKNDPRSNPEIFDFFSKRGKLK